LTTDAGQVTDPTGKSAAGTVGTFQVGIDPAAPAASLAAPAAVANATAGQTLTVTYTAPAAAYAPAVLADRPAVYYRLGDAAGGTTAADASGNGHPGTYAAAGGGGYAPGQPGAVVGDGDTAVAFSSPAPGAGGYVQPTLRLNSGAATV